MSNLLDDKDKEIMPLLGDYSYVPTSDDAEPIHANESTNRHLSQSNYYVSSAFLVFFFPALGGLLFGYDIGGTSAVITQIQSSEYSGISWYSQISESSVIQGFVTAATMLGAVLGSATCFSIADTIGRKRSLILASILFFTGGIIEFLSGQASFHYSTGLTMLVIGRLVYGYACGFAMHGAPAYIGEMAPSKIRGFLISLKEVFIVLGMVLGYSIGFAYSEVIGGWRYVYLWSCLFSILMFVGMMYLPFSARWLALKGRLTEARQSLLFVSQTVSIAEMEAVAMNAQKASQAQNNNNNSNNISTFPTKSINNRDEVTIIRYTNHNNNTNNNFSSTWNRLTSPTVWPAIVAGVGLVFFQQATGQPSVLYYADSIFVDIGLSTVAAIAVSIFKLIMTMFATFTVDKYGRKLLLYIGTSCMLIALIMLTIIFLFPYKSTETCQSYNTEDSCSNGCEWSQSCAESCNVEAGDEELVIDRILLLFTSTSSNTTTTTDDAITNSTNITDTSSSSSSSSSSIDYTNCNCCNTDGLNFQKSLILISLFIYIGGYQIGYGPISWLLISEIFPLEVRSQAVAIAVITNFFCNSVVTFLFPITLTIIGSSATFLIFTIILLWGIYFIYRHVPETKGLTLEEIEEYFIRSSHTMNNNHHSHNNSDGNNNNSNNSNGSKFPGVI